MTEAPSALDLTIKARTKEDLSTGAARKTHESIWRCVQRGLVYPSPAALFVTVFARGEASQITKAAMRSILEDARSQIHSNHGDAHTTVILGVGFKRWRVMSAGDGSTVPLGMADASGAAFRHPGTVFTNSGADLWFHVKSDDADHCAALGEWLRHRLEVVESWADPERTVLQSAATRSTDPRGRGGRVLGSRFPENLNNATDPITIQAQAVVGFEDPPHMGASFVLAQRFTINWEQILGMSPEQVEDLVGRTTHEVLIPAREDRSHIKRARAQDGHGNTISVLRLGLPFGESQATARGDLLDQGASRHDEAGIYFAGYARSAKALETIMDRQNGDVAGFMADRLLSNVSSDLGGIYYVPSLPDLGMDLEESIAVDTPLGRYPGVDWTRLDRHFDQASSNGYMHYNHKEYLYRMTTMNEAERTEFRPPSHRVLSLLANAFSRWQDTWYFDRSQQELEHLSTYLEQYLGADRAEEIMALSIEERSGWAAMMLLGRVLVSEEYGFRGRRQVNGYVVSGADTFRIHPAEIIVGAMPNLGLGQGKYLIDFARDDEQLANFFDNLSYAAGVGHVVPTFKRAIRLGLGELIADAERRRDACNNDEKRRRFYAGNVLALEAVAEHCRAFARLAGEMAAAAGPGQTAERDNLLEICERMDRLAVSAPETLADAAQLVFTLHSCLHHVGEPTAIGRLDQLLQSFYEDDVAAGRIDEERAQEIIDCFWIKVGEKVQLNRHFVEDHQVFGNLAVGGASGNYPQGSSLNQWIQQVTVGGTIADDTPGAGAPAYNDLTMLCLRAARRLPLNAPCLSLRMRSDIPDDLIHEAALGVLSGGAHPIFLSDQKIIPGLQASGDRIGAGHGVDGAPTPVSVRARGLWRSEVSLADARAYASDGCYEPQLAGTSWFTLGGMIATSPLEAALNQGKVWQMAGPAWFRGQKVSFTSEPARAVESFDRLMELYFTHLRWMYAKQVDGQLSIFGRMNGACPASLLSVFIEDCQEKGLDFYEGGARYNVVAPCFTGLSTLIDSLWAIRAMVFDPATATTSLPELVDALRCDWGEHMVEPFVSVLEGPARIAGRAERFRRLRTVAMALPKYGHGNADIDQFGDQIVGRVAATAVEVFIDPAERTAAKMLALAEAMGTEDHPFGGFQIQPGVGSFENYLDWGNMAGASADGRRSGDSVASDLSAAPSFGDLAIDHRESPMLEVMAGYSGPGVGAMWDGAPADFNIREDFPPDSLKAALRAFAQGHGSSVMTITCADPETFEAATVDPEKFDLLRVRMGGWSEFFVAMFPAHQSQHRRRPLQA